MSRLSTALKAFLQLGPRQVGLYAWYQLGLRTGWLRRLTTDSGQRDAQFVIRSLFPLPPREQLAVVLGDLGQAKLLAQADEIVAGKARLFGGEPALLELSPPGELKHWTEYELEYTETPEHGDIKFVWEQARFGWTFTLGQAYHLSGDERYPEAFWRFAETFWESNPPYRGPNWVSAQEVALRLMAFTFAAQIFARSAHSTPERLTRLSESVATHAARIPPTLVYARAQNNNHLLSEAAGMITAGLALPDHPQARRWLSLGQKWFTTGLQQQIAPDGTYIQHSTNYHRLMLQIAQWVCTIIRSPFQPVTLSRLAPATHWLLALVDPDTGRVPNLGPNDGAYIFPLTTLPFDDYRPVLQAASAAFLGQRAFPAGPWDEVGLWLCSSAPLQVPGTKHQNSRDTAHTLHAPHSWAYLRAATFHSRPSHADQLHLDLWWRGLNVAQDAGTYLYNAPPPWDNALAHTAVHNTITFDGQDQMNRGGRFLWLDWAQGKITSCEKAPDGSWERLTAQHDGYRRLGIIHQRAVTAFRDDRWLAEDTVLFAANVTRDMSHEIRLHWLLPDWPWEAENRDSGLEIRLQSLHGWITLRVQSPIPHLLSPSVIRAGQLLHGSGPANPILGWTSPIYGTKIPALSLVIEACGPLPLTLTSEWIFPQVI